MHIQYTGLSTPKKDTVVILVSDACKLSTKGKELDKQVNGAITKALKTAQFKGKLGHTLSVYTPGDMGIDRIVVLGVGKPKTITEIEAQNVGGKLYAMLNSVHVKHATVIIDESFGAKLSDADIAADIGYGVLLRSYRFDKYQTKDLKDKAPSLAKLAIQLKSQQKATEAYAEKAKVAEGIFLARDVVTEPPNILYPESYAERCVEELSGLGIKVTVLTPKEMKKLNMGALLGVGQGSVRESRMVIMEYHGAAKSKKPIAFVGKGVTFDTGGISIKPANGMEDMKYDMGGSAAVVGLMKALAGRKAKVNAIGVIGLVENMPDGNAQRPSDVVNTMSGQTVEVLNTDAEGRLVLADALWYTQEKFKPQFMINLATLTGAIVVALGEEYAGLFSNNDKLSKQLTEVGEVTGEKLWRFPLHANYDKMINSDIADIKNISDGRGAGSITAAQFLQRFVNDVPWAHLDIAGTAWTKKPQDTTPKGAVGFGVRLLNRLVKEHYEE
ncbi:MAG: leucyl aminopeptidase [Alphaproteobacteria bacterium]|nr:leucyl aminopeptidase [Alphaproteobacteria bacterium]